MLYLCRKTIDLLDKRIKLRRECVQNCACLRLGRLNVPRAQKRPLGRAQMRTSRQAQITLRG